MVALLFNTVNWPASVRVALRKHCRRVATSFESVVRAHTSHALSWSASETLIVSVSFPWLMLSFLTGPAESSRVRVRAFSLRFSASSQRLHPHRLPSRLTSRSSRPRIVASTACFALRLHAVAAPLWVGLTLALAPMKIFIAFLLATLIAVSTATASACVPIQPNPLKDAQNADAIFVATATSERMGFLDATVMYKLVTLLKTTTLKGFAPATIEVSPDCGDHFPEIGERVIVVRLNKQFIIRRAGNQYERSLMDALSGGR